MALTKSAFTVQSSATQTATSTTTATGVDLSGAYNASLGVKITNGGTGPTLAGTCQIQLSPDNSAWYDYGGVLTGGVANNGVYSWEVELPDSVYYVRTVFSGNTGQSITIEAVGQKTTAI